VFIQPVLDLVRALLLFVNESQSRDGVCPDLRRNLNDVAVPQPCSQWNDAAIYLRANRLSGLLQSLNVSQVDRAGIHSAERHLPFGAKVMAAFVPLRTRLRNGDIVEITTQSGHTPSRDWLSFTKEQQGAEQDQALAE